MKQILSFFLILIIINGLYSCKNEEPVTVYKGYSFITSTLANQDTVYGIGFSSVTNKYFNSVEAIHSTSAKKYTLAAIENHTNNFGYETSFEDMTASLPEIGKYTFTFNIVGETFTSTDSLTSNVIHPTVIDNCFFNEDEERIEVSWEAIQDAGYIHVFLKTSDGARVFATKSALGATATSTNISAVTAGWMEGFVPEANNTFNVEIHAYRFKAGSNNSARDGIQARSITQGGTVVWK